MFILIFVTVGSRNYPFDRLFIKLDELFDKGILKGELFAHLHISQGILNIKTLYHKKSFQS